MFIACKSKTWFIEICKNWTRLNDDGNQRDRDLTFPSVGFNNFIYFALQQSCQSTRIERTVRLFEEFYSNCQTQKQNCKIFFAHDSVGHFAAREILIYQGFAKKFLN